MARRDDIADLEEFGRFGEPALLILVSLGDGAKHGYAITEDIARRVLRKALTLRTTTAVKRYMAEELTAIAPNLQMLDTA